MVTLHVNHKVRMFWQCIGIFTLSMSMRCLAIEDTGNKEAEGLLQCKDEPDPSMICSKLPHYNKHVPPNSRPNVISPYMIFWQVNDVNEKKQTITFIAYVGLGWQDDRLQVKQNLSSSMAVITLLLEDLWVPEIIFPTSIQIKRVGGLKGESLRSLSYSYYEGGLWFSYSDALVITSQCQMNFETFPFDHQYCQWSLNSQLLTSDELLLKTISISTSFNRNYKAYSVNESAELFAPGISFNVQVLTTHPLVEDFEGYKLSSTGLEFHFQRKSNEVHRLFSSFFFPSGTFAILSLCSFSIKPDIVPGRMGMLVTIFLIVTGIYNTVDAPLSRGFSFIELWYVGVQVPIIFAILQYGLILTIMKYVGHQKEIKIMEEMMTIESALKKLDLMCSCISLFFIAIFGAYFAFSCFNATNQ